MKKCLVFLGVLLFAVPIARADLTVQEVNEDVGTGIQYTDDYYIITDTHNGDDLWEALVDKNTGAIFSFKDLGDDGVQGPLPGQVDPPLPYSLGDHVNYLGTTTDALDHCYHIQTTMYIVDGRADSIMTRNDAAPGLADRLTFSWDADAFTINYDEDDFSESYIWDVSTYIVASATAAFLEVQDVAAVAGLVTIEGNLGSYEFDFSDAGTYDATAIATMINDQSASTGVTATVDGNGYVELRSAVTGDTEYVKVTLGVGGVFDTLDAAGDPATEDYGEAAQGAGLPEDAQTDVEFVMNKTGDTATVWTGLVTTTIAEFPLNGTMDGRPWATGYIMTSLQQPEGYGYYGYGIDTVYDEEDARREEGAWNGGDPTSYGRQTIITSDQNTALGLVVGRQIILDHVQGYSNGGYDYTNNGTFSESGWANADYVRENCPFKYGTMDGGTIKLWQVDLRLNIGTIAPGVPDGTQCSIDGEPEQILDDGVETCTVTVTIRDGFGLPVEGVAASDVQVSVDPPDGCVITQPASATDEFGVTTASFTCTERGIKTINATVSVGGTPQAITNTDDIQVFSSGVELGYSYHVPSNSSYYGYYVLIVTAYKSMVPISELKFVVPITVPGETTHTYYTPGQVCSLKDLMINDDSEPLDPAFNYTKPLTEPSWGQGDGALQFGGSDEYHRQPSIYQNEVQNADYYQFEILTPSVEDAHPSGYGDRFFGGHVRGLKVMRVNKPVMYAGDSGYTWDIEGSMTITNTSTDTFTGWTMTSGGYNNIGSMTLNLRSNGMDGTPYDGSFINPDSPMAKPNVHDQIGDDHPLYACADWYGTLLDLTDPLVLDPPLAENPRGVYMSAVVKNNADVATNQMWPDAIFELTEDTIPFSYNGQGVLYGSTTQAAGYVSFNCNTYGTFAVGEEFEPDEVFTFYYDGLFDFVGGGGEPLAITAALDYPWVYQNTVATTQNRHLSVLTITLVTEAQPGESYTITLGEGGGALANFTTVDNGDLTVDIIGGNANTTTASAPASYQLNVTVTGDSSGQFDTANVDLKLSLIGDITGDGFINAIDKVHINAWLNGVPLPGDVVRHVDLTGDTFVNAVDKVQMNRQLNGLGIL